MDDTLTKIMALIKNGSVRISSHGYDELASDAIRIRDIVDSIEGARLVEDYPEYPKGPCVLVLQRAADGSAIHAVWGIPRGSVEPAVLKTAYRPDPKRWTEYFMRRIR